MLNINVTHNFKQVGIAIAALGKQARFATAVALTRTAQDLQRQIPAELDKVLDNPTPFTKRGTYVAPARRDTLRAEVGFRPVQARYMALQIEGGTVQPGAAGIKLPGNIQLNAFGNIPKGLTNKLKAAAKSGVLGPAVAKRLGLNRMKRDLNRGDASRIDLFYGQPRGRGWENAPVGIWRRLRGRLSERSEKLVPVIVFDKKPARYRARFDFKALAQRTVDQRFAGHFNTEFRKALATAR